MRSVANVVAGGVMLTAPQRARIRILARACTEAGDFRPLIAYIEGLAVAPDAGIAQLMAERPAPKRRLYLGTWARIKGLFA